MSAGLPLSQHPVDQLIRELIDTRRPATPDEIRQIVDRMAAVPFGSGQIPVPRKYRGLIYLGYTLGSSDDALVLHLTQRVVAEGQWVVGTSAGEYVGDLRRAVRAPSARLAVYLRRGGHVATVVCRTADVVSPERLGPGTLPWLIVVYSADRGILVSGYQFSSFATVSIPEDALWLR